MMKLLPVLIVLLTLPLIAIGFVLLVRRSQLAPNLAKALVLSGVTGALVTGLLAFTASTVPIAPYETSRGAWMPMVWQSLLSLYIGFGLGVAMGAIGASPYLLIRLVRKRQRPEQDESGAAAMESNQGH